MAANIRRHKPGPLFDFLALVPRDQWPAKIPSGLRRVWLSKSFLVQEYDAIPPALVRLSVNRVSRYKGEWSDGITWDDLQRIKDEVGYAESCAVEVYPPVSKVVNVANIRHIWVLIQTPRFVWGQDDTDDKATDSEAGDGR